MSGVARWPGGNLLNPVPVVLVSCADGAGRDNVLTVAWTGTVCSDPPMLSVSIRPERHSHALIEASGEFVVNLVGSGLARAADWCGVKSGRDVDKWAGAGLHRRGSRVVGAPQVDESPLSLECVVRHTLRLGSHDMYVAEVVGVTVREELLDPSSGSLDLGRAGLVAYSHGAYYELGRRIGRFGWSVRKRRG